MGTVLVTERITYQDASAGESLFPRRADITITPGPAESAFLRKELGDVLYDAAVRLGVIVEIP